MQASASHHWPPPPSTLLHLGLVSHVIPASHPLNREPHLLYGEVLGHPITSGSLSFSPISLKSFVPLSSFFFWFGFAFAKEELLPSLSQSSPTHIMYSLHLKVQTSLSFSPTYSHIASLSSLEAFP